MTSEMVFVGLGLSGTGGMTVDALAALRECDKIYAEFYTSTLIGTEVEELEKAVGKRIEVIHRHRVEEGGEDLVLEAKNGRIGFVTAGDTMAATTHVDLRIQAAIEGIPVRLFHGISVFSACPSAFGLQPYKFGRTVTLPFIEDGYHPQSPYDNIMENKIRGLHSMILLDIRAEQLRYMTAKEGIEWLLEGERKWKGGLIGDDTLVCAASKIGSGEQKLTAGYPRDLLETDLGEPLSTIVIPGNLHFMEAHALVFFAGAPEGILKDQPEH